MRHKTNRADYLNSSNAAKKSMGNEETSGAGKYTPRWRAPLARRGRFLNRSSPGVGAGPSNHRRAAGFKLDRYHSSINASPIQF